ncbi:hypothetical protein AB0I77_51585 [Streptomyces sp. NPDC050619]|uniref:hypothetical protein n=1 Tax=Streptomyces sp. NPDC050619 TaxID=3157214 RepID=UPI003424E135
MGAVHALRPGAAHGRGADPRGGAGALEEREREIAARAEATRERIEQLTARLDELGGAAEEVRISRKTVLELPDPSPPAPPASMLPDHPAYRQIALHHQAGFWPPRTR